MVDTMEGVYRRISARIMDCPVKMILIGRDCGHAVDAQVNSIAKQAATSASFPSLYFARLGISVLLECASENRQRVQRRTGSQCDSQRRSREQKFIAVHLSRVLDGSFELEIVENIYAH